MTPGFQIAATRPHLHLRLVGRLTADDYHGLAPVIDQELADHRRIRMLVELTDAFEGWTAGAAWQDLKLDLTHWNDFDRIAIVGDLKKWQEIMVKFTGPFTKADLKTFGSVQDADAWLDD